MDSIYLEIIVLMLLVWIFENKLIPQIIIMFLTLIMMLNQISIATDLRSEIATLILYAVIIIYSALSTQKEES